LFFNLFPNKTYAYKAESPHGGNMSKYRITVLLCANIDGYEKLVLLVNGKSVKPWCFKRVKSLSRMYRCNSNACITYVLFKEFLICFGRRMSGRELESTAVLRPMCSTCQRYQSIKKCASGISANQHNIGPTINGPRDNLVDSKGF
jgi:hypothetical protein